MNKTAEQLASSLISLVNRDLDIYTMNASRTAKEVKRGSVSPLKTPEKPRLPRNSPVVKKPLIRSKLAQTTKLSHTKSSSQIAYLELIKQISVNILEGSEKIRRIIAFSRLRPIFEVCKSVFRKHLEQYSNFVKTKILLKSWEALALNKDLRKNQKVLKILEGAAVNLELERLAERHRKKKLMEKSMNGLMKFYCESSELSAIFEEFIQKKIKRKCFEAIFLDSKYDEVVNEFLKVRRRQIKTLPKYFVAWRDAKIRY